MTSQQEDRIGAAMLALARAENQKRCFPSPGYSGHRSPAPKSGRGASYRKAIAEITENPGQSSEYYAQRLGITRNHLSQLVWSARRAGVPIKSRRAARCKVHYWLEGEE
jgi:hypothetical protein